jgi:hypothetical protein
MNNGKAKLVVKYPPDYDGELHIHTNTKVDEIGAVVTIQIEVRAKPGETLKQLVGRVGMDMQRAR